MCRVRCSEFSSALSNQRPTSLVITLLCFCSDYSTSTQFHGRRRRPHSLALPDRRWNRTFTLVWIISWNRALLTTDPESLAWQAAARRKVSGAALDTGGSLRRGALAWQGWVLVQFRDQVRCAQHFSAAARLFSRASPAGLLDSGLLLSSGRSGELRSSVLRARSRHTSNWDAPPRQRTWPSLLPPVDSTTRPPQTPRRPSSMLALRSNTITTKSLRHRPCRIRLISHIIPR